MDHAFRTIEDTPEYHKVMTPVQAYRVEVYCPNDGSPLVSTGMAYATYPEQYPHECRTCDHKVVLGSLYPKIEYR